MVVAISARSLAHLSGGCRDEKNGSITDHIQLVTNILNGLVVSVVGFFNEVELVADDDNSLRRARRIINEARRQRKASEQKKLSGLVRNVRALHSSFLSQGKRRRNETHLSLVGD